MVAVNTGSKVSGLARALVGRGRLSETDAESAFSQATNSGLTFIEQLTLSKKLFPLEIAEFCSQTFGYPLLDLNSLEQENLPRDALTAKMMQAHRLLPLFKRGTQLFVALSDPTQVSVLSEIKFQTGLTVYPVVVEDNKLALAVQKLVKATDTSLKDLVSDDIALNFTDDSQAEADAGQEVEDAPVVKFIQKILLDAISAGASDIHFEPYEKYYRIRCRMDGVLYDTAQPPLVIKDKIASRIKVISKLDISEKRVPQDGRMKLLLAQNRAIDFRVSTLPTLFGEKLVLRILDSSNTRLGLETLGYEPDQKQQLLDAISRPYGMILVTGPTGSGKTVSLYSCLDILNKPGINISTAEDPAEINMAGINQVNINEKAGLDFATALRAFLRQDPDIIMVGEIRDLETADIAIKAAQTGHLVLSTLHTNDAPTTLTRLMNMGVAPFNVASSVILITAQRLARKLCSCKRPADIPPEALLDAGFSEEDLDGSWQPFTHGSCDICKGTGYKGRTGIYQVMPISEEMERIIMSHGNALDVAEQAKLEGVNDLRRSGLVKVKQGVTSLEEVEAVTNE
ncbi:MAG: type IV-A pilus assembly ATPase PilB [Burkholderiales bacterium]